MAGRRGQVNYQTVIKTEDEYNKSISEENNRLTMVDVYSHWCGECKLLAPIVKNIALKIDEWEKRVEFIAVSTDVVPELAEIQNSSQPKFLFYKQGQLITTVEGLNVPVIQQIVAEHLPDIDD